MTAQQGFSWRRMESAKRRQQAVWRSLSIPVAMFISFNLGLAVALSSDKALFEKQLLIVFSTHLPLFLILLYVRNILFASLQHGVSEEFAFVSNSKSVSIYGNAYAQEYDFKQEVLSLLSAHKLLKLIGAVAVIFIFSAAFVSISGFSCLISMMLLLSFYPTLMLLPLLLSVAMVFFAAPAQIIWTWSGLLVSSLFILQNLYLLNHLLRVTKAYPGDDFRGIKHRWRRLGREFFILMVVITIVFTLLPKYDLTAAKLKGGAGHSGSASQKLPKLSDSMQVQRKVDSQDRKKDQKTSEGPRDVKEWQGDKQENADLDLEGYEGVSKGLGDGSGEGEGGGISDGSGNGIGDGSGQGFGNGSGSGDGAGHGKGVGQGDGEGDGQGTPGGVDGGTGDADGTALLKNEKQNESESQTQADAKKPVEPVKEKKIKEKKKEINLKSLMIILIILGILLAIAVMILRRKKDKKEEAPEEQMPDLSSDTALDSALAAEARAYLADQNHTSQTRLAFVVRAYHLFLERMKVLNIPKHESQTAKEFSDVLCHQFKYTKQDASIITRVFSQCCYGKQAPTIDEVHLFIDAILHKADHIGRQRFSN